MFSNIFQKAAVFGASTVAGVALSGVIAANPAQAASLNRETFRSEFSVTSNSLNGADFLTGSFDFTKTEQGNGLFDYTVTRFNAEILGDNFTLKDIRNNPNPFIVINQTLIPEKHQTILPSVINKESSNYTGNGDFGEGSVTLDLEFKPADILKATEVASKLLTVDPQFTNFYVPFALQDGVKLNITTQEVPEPATIFGLGVMGVGLTATRRRSMSKKNKQKIAA